MAVKIAGTEKKQDPIKGSLGAIGSLVGGLFGPIGGALGGAIGGMVGGAKAKDVVPGAAMEAVTSRMNKTSAPKDLEAGMRALEKQDPAMQQQYGPTLMAALEKSRAPQQPQYDMDAVTRRQQRSGGMA
jgi:outer membrane lipoprotein SlyB